MKKDNNGESGLLYVKVTDVRPIDNNKFGKSKLFLKLGDQTTSISCDLSFR